MHEHKHNRVLLMANRDSPWLLLRLQFLLKRIATELCTNTRQLCENGR